MIDEAFAATQKFFELQYEHKRKYLHTRSKEGDPGNDGYVRYQQETLDLSKPNGDLKEAFDVCSYINCCYPDEEVPEFRTTMMRLFASCRTLANKLLEMIGYALKLEDPLFFVKTHQMQGQGHTDNLSVIRASYYPPLMGETKENEVRCGEHVDLGSITLLFQSPGGGLQVRRRDGGYVDVPYMPDAVLVNLGHAIQRLTNNLYIASPHRVLVPKDKEKRQAVRQSIAYFAHADNDVVMKPVIGGDKECTPLSAKEYTNKRILETIHTLPEVN